MRPRVPKPRAAGDWASAPKPGQTQPSEARTREARPQRMHSPGPWGIRGRSVGQRPHGAQDGAASDSGPVEPHAAPARAPTVRGEARRQTPQTQPVGQARERGSPAPWSPPTSSGGQRGPIKPGATPGATAASSRGHHRDHDRGHPGQCPAPPPGPLAFFPVLRRMLPVLLPVFPLALLLVLPVLSPVPAPSNPQRTHAPRLEGCPSQESITLVSAFPPNHAQTSHPTKSRT
jgi:hypothetical protein